MVTAMRAAIGGGMVSTAQVANSLMRVVTAARPAIRVKLSRLWSQNWEGPPKPCSLIMESAKSKPKRSAFSTMVRLSSKLGMYCGLVVEISQPLLPMGMKTPSCMGRGTSRLGDGSLRGGGLEVGGGTRLRRDGLQRARSVPRARPSHRAGYLRAWRPGCAPRPPARGQVLRPAWGAGTPVSGRCRRGAGRRPSGRCGRPGRRCRPRPAVPVPPAGAQAALPLPVLRR